MSSKIFAKDHYCAKFQAVFSLLLSNRPHPFLTLMSVWRLQEKIIRTVLCYIVYDSCVQ